MSKGDTGEASCINYLRDMYLPSASVSRLIDSKISTPMSQYEQYRKSRTSWGINVLGSFCVELEASDG